MKKNVVLYSGIALIIGFLSGGFLMYEYIHPNLTFFENEFNRQENDYNEVTNYTCNQKDVKEFLKEFNTTNTPYHWYLTGTASLACRSGFKAYHTYDEALPTPTPIIKYQTNTVTKTQFVEAPGQTGYYYTEPVTYTRAGSELLGSNGSTCIMAGSQLSCSGGR
jgi:hypothetical protein